MSFHYCNAGIPLRESFLNYSLQDCEITCLVWKSMHIFNYRAPVFFFCIIFPLRSTQRAKLRTPLEWKSIAADDITAERQAVRVTNVTRHPGQRQAACRSDIAAEQERRLAQCQDGADGSSSVVGLWWRHPRQDRRGRGTAGECTAGAMKGQGSGRRIGRQQGLLCARGALRVLSTYTHESVRDMIIRGPCVRRLWGLVSWGSGPRRPAGLSAVEGRWQRDDTTLTKDQLSGGDMTCTWASSAVRARRDLSGDGGMDLSTPIYHCCEKLIVSMMSLYASTCFLGLNGTTRV